MKIRVRYRKYKGRWFEYLLASKEEVKLILKGTGWKVKQFVDSEGERQSRYTAIIRKTS